MKKIAIYLLLLFPYILFGEVNAWSNEVNGIKARLLVDEINVLEQNRVDIELEFSNVSDRDLTLLLANPTCLTFIVYKNDREVESTSKYAEYAFAWKVNEINSSRLLHMKIGSYDNGQYIIEVGKLEWELEAGDYYLQVVYNVNLNDISFDLGEVWEGKIVTPRFKFTVGKKYLSTGQP